MNMAIAAFTKERISTDDLSPRSTFARKAGPFGILTWNGNLRLCARNLRGVIATCDWAKVNEGVLFLSLIGEPSWPPLLSSQVHLDMVV
jgi:hypothetical protein